MILNLCLSSRYSNTNIFGKTESCDREVPLIVEGSKVFLYAFPTSYLVERGINVVSQVLTKARNHLNGIERGDLRLRLTAITPDIEQLMSQHQVQPSH